VLSSVGPNALDPAKYVSNASSAVVSQPNVDTLYTRVAVDLSSNDLIITIPEINDRFYIFPFYDMYAPESLQEISRSVY
jgi:hypothetical protein